MAGYTLQGKTSSGAMVDIPLAATYDSAGNKIVDYYAGKPEYEAIMSKLLGMDSKLDLLIGTLDTATWSTIAAASKMGVASMLWHVGDEKQVTLTTGEKITLVIVGFNHDDLVGGGKAGITFGMKNCLTTTYPMNSSATNAGSWKDSIMRTSTLATIYDYLPDEVKAVIKPVIKKTSAGEMQSTIVETEDKLFLFSTVEVMGTIMYNASTQIAFNGEGEQYEYYKNAPIPAPNSGTGSFSALTGTSGTFYTTSTSVASGYMNRFNQSKSTSANVYYNYNNAKATGDSGTASSSWWLRSPYCYGATFFCYVSNGGSSGFNNASYSYGVAFGFCV